MIVLAATLLVLLVIVSVQIPRAAAAMERGAALTTRDESPLPTISVRANAIVKVQPTSAYFEVGILTQDKSAAKAQDIADRVIARILETLKKRGVEGKDLATSVCNVRPSYEGLGQDRRKLIGYHADNFVTVNVRDLSRLGEIIDACMAAGATNISDVEFRVDDIRAYRKQGRGMAVRNARERAEQLADAMGVKIMRVQSIEETTSDYVSYGRQWWQSRRESAMSQAVAFASADTAAEEPEIALGTFPISAGVRVSFEIQ
jgi:uncharacterized protein YggE